MQQPGFTGSRQAFSLEHKMRFSGTVGSLSVAVSACILSLALLAGDVTAGAVSGLRTTEFQVGRERQSPLLSGLSEGEVYVSWEGITLEVSKASRGRRRR